MEYIVTAGEMKAYDNNTIHDFGVPSLVLMERAALCVCESVMEKPDCRTVLVLCGAGNNGGDGFAVARILYTKGYQVKIVFAGTIDKMTPECRTQYESVCKYKIAIEEAKHSLQFLTRTYDVVIDALFGISLSRPVEGIYRQIIETANQMPAFRVAVDVPSGLHADSGEVMGIAFAADLTVTFGFCKTGLLLGSAKDCCGKVILADIGITKESFLGRIPGQFSYTREDILRIPKRKRTSHKGSFGKVTLIAGSRDMGGAAVLCAKSLCRSGCGYVRVLTHESNRNALLMQIPEVVVTTYADTLPDSKGCQGVFDFATVLVIGPGLSQTDSAKALLLHVLKQETKPLVLDADAINLISQSKELKSALKEQDADRQIIMTPHMMELKRFSGVDIPVMRRELLKRAAALAREYRIVLVCKDASTAVFDGRSRKGMDSAGNPPCDIYINQSGNDALATAGSGDVLTGIIGAMLAKGMDAMESACMGVYLHGLCAEEASRAAGSKSYINAGDLANELCRLLE